MPGSKLKITLKIILITVLIHTVGLFIFMRTKNLDITGRPLSTNENKLEFLVPVTTSPEFKADKFEKESLANRVLLSSLGKEYLKKIELSLTPDKSLIAHHCGANHFQESVPLGCYLPMENKIFILEVSDERLEGVSDATFAHELLHVIYQSLSESEKSNIKALINLAMQNASQFTDINQRIGLYSHKDRETRIDELHSLLGTEVEDLPRELEKHYDKYFQNRRKIVVFANRYKKLFAKRSELLNHYEKEIFNLQGEIERRTQYINQNDSYVEALKRNAKENLRLGNPDEHNKLVIQINSRNREMAQYKTKTNEFILEYNEKLRIRNNFTTESNSLSFLLNTKSRAPGAEH